jgi:HSP20 family molecular chaperone IbpA
VFEIACTGLSKSEVSIDIELDVLKVSYNKPKVHDGTEEARTYQCRGVARRSFNLAYKISPKYNLSQSTAQMENGLLIITVPFAEEAKPKKLQMK